ncbi:hypothetical protein ABH992_008123 [Bradyrhizobium yuanmingense]|uniref:Uncharacterized protein n=1 Tax=Bradyrhizobium yuanmingense TaxID=108015 RepID=A0ABV4GUT3_9BRAD
MTSNLTRIADGLLRRTVSDRSRQRSVAVPGGLGPVDHFRRDPDREFRARRLLHDRRLHRLHVDRAPVRCVRLLGQHRDRRVRRGADRRHRRDGAAPAHLSCARAVPAARDVRPDLDGRGSRRADLGAGRSRRPPRAGLQGRDRLFRPEHSELRPVPDRARSRRARHSLAAVPAHALGRAGARGDAGPRHGGCAWRQPKVAVHERVRRRRLPRSARRRASDPARCRAPRHGPADHRRGLRRGRDRRPRQHRRRLRRGGAGLRAECLRHPDLPEDLHHPCIPGDGRGADRASLGPVRQAGGGRAQDAGSHRQSLAAADLERAADGACGADRRSDAAAVRRQLSADRGLGDRDFRDLRRQPALPDVGRRASHRSVTPPILAWAPMASPSSPRWRDCR